RREPGIIGVYSAGGDNKGVARVLEANKAGRPFWVGHELTGETQDYLSRGIMSIVLDQAPEVQARRSIDLALNRLGLIEVEVSAEPVRFLTITSENL
ncbi:LacI family transcriptional regulator, partial [Rhizobium ruizarguesonis]